MKRTVPSRAKRVLAAAGVLAIGATGMVGQAAFADQNTPQTGNISVGNVNPEQKGSLTLHKHEENAGSTAGNPAGAPVKDVEFTVYQLFKGGAAIDLTAPSSWDDLGKLKVSASCDDVTGATGYTIGSTVKSDKTDEDGVVAFDPLNVGAYVVCETAAPSSVVKKAQPFVVTIPRPENGVWNYNVVAYPKNVLASIDKTIRPQADLKIGSEITFPVTADVPALLADTQWKYFQIVDPMDSHLSNITVKNVKLGTVALEASDYEVVDLGNGQTALQFTRDGLDKFKVNGPTTVSADFVGTLTSLPDDGKVKNKAYLRADTFVPTDPENPTNPENPGEPVDPENPGVPETPEVVSNWGDLKLLKKDQNGTALGNATFEVYASSDPYATACDATTKAGDPIDTATSNANGVVTFDGLFISDSKNDPGKDATSRCYVLVETVAPAGFVKLSDPIAVYVKIGKNGPTVYDQEITNTKQGVPELPLTGAAGRVLLIASGLALISIAGGLYLVRRRKTADQ